jgi:hypothetical protein
MATIRGNLRDNAAYIDVAAAGTSGAVTAKAQVVHVVNSAGVEAAARLDQPYEAAGTLTPLTTAYALAQALGGLITVDIGAAVGVSMANEWIRVTLTAVVLRADAAPTNQTIAPVLFDANPSASTFTDQTTSALAAADVSKVVSWISTSASGGSNVVGNAIHWVTQWTADSGLLVQCDANGRIYMALMLGGACTPGAGASVSWRVQFGADV